MRGLSVLTGSAIARRTASLLLGFGIVIASDEAAAQTSRLPDFDGDGFSDLAIGVPGESRSGLADVGAVHVLYGRASGLAAGGEQLWTQDSPGIQDLAETGDGFGSAVGFGDFDGDGFSDLAVGVPFEDEGGMDAGAVHVLYGSASGLSSAGAQFWHQQVSDVPGVSAPGDRFGFAVTGGDFDDDGFDDLAIGVIGDELTFQGAPVDDAGSVIVLYGSGSGVVTAGAQFFTQNALADSPKVDDLFGWALTAGDFDGDGFDDLVIGAPFEDTAKLDTGIVFLLPGSAGGIAPGPASEQFFLQGHRSFPDVNCPIPDVGESCQEVDDLFGYAVAAGDFDGDGFDDLVIGVPHEEFDSALNNSGQVHVLNGTSNGPRRIGSLLLHQDRPNVLDTAERDDQFGRSLASGDFDGDGFDDLVVGATRETIEAAGPGSHGIVQIFPGGSGGVTTTGQQRWSQDSPGIPDAPEDGDFFGTALGAGDFDDDGATDLAIGVPQENLGAVADAGVLHVLYGGLGTGLAPAGNQLWTQDSAGVGEASEAGDEFGSAVPGS